MQAHVRSHVRCFTLRLLPSTCNSSYNRTGAMLYYSLKDALEHKQKLVGTVFSETLPSSVREAILSKVPDKLLEHLR